MGGVSIWHWLVVIVGFASFAWYLASTAKLLRAAGRSQALVLLVLVPIIGPPLVQSWIAQSLAR
jgi:uncharacterized membrane protein YhaH (DUF805 family)